MAHAREQSCICCGPRCVHAVVVVVVVFVVIVMMTMMTMVMMVVMMMVMMMMMMMTLVVQGVPVGNVMGLHCLLNAQVQHSHPPQQHTHLNT